MPRDNGNGVPPWVVTATRMLIIAWIIHLTAITLRMFSAGIRGKLHVQTPAALHIAERSMNVSRSRHRPLRRQKFVATQTRPIMAVLCPAPIRHHRFAKIQTRPIMAALSLASTRRRLHHRPKLARIPTPQTMGAVCHAHTHHHRFARIPTPQTMVELCRASTHRLHHRPKLARIPTPLTTAALYRVHTRLRLRQVIFRSVLIYPPHGVCLDRIRFAAVALLVIIPATTSADTRFP